MTTVDLLRPLWRLLPFDIRMRQRIKRRLLRNLPWLLGSFRSVIDRPAWNEDWSLLLPPLDRPPDRILIMDAERPIPDFLDPGSSPVCRILDLLREAGFALDLICDAMSDSSDASVCGNRSPGGPDARTTVASLEAAGIPVIVGRRAALSHLPAQGHRYRAALVSRPEAAEIYIPLLRAHAPGARIVYVTADPCEARSAPAPNLDAELAPAWWRIELANAEAADLTLVSADDARQRLLSDLPGLEVRTLPRSASAMASILLPLFAEEAPSHA